MFNSFGPLEIGLVLLIVLVIFGPKRLPGLGKQLGRGMREFKESITGESKDDDDHDAASPERATLAAAPPAPPAPPQAPATSPDAASEALGRPPEAEPAPNPRP
ncbi:MAG: sec-independent protein translocase protein TatA [Solirubrobacteraceae bacterium]|jgi:sec-independent protein translocase protein TatA|nr:sec-independent protein translocase protein TatA [Solirubrobacteraceae bacterium]